MNRKLNLAVGLLVATLTGCASTPEPLEISDTEEIEATVTAVDAETRLLALRGPAGNEIVFRAGPDVRNLAQVEVGDTLRVSYYSGFVFSIAEPGNAGSDVEIAAGRSEEGDRPGAMVGVSTRSTVEILSVAADGTAVSFRDAEGQIQSLSVQREDGQAFARKLKPGDLVDIHYSEAIAVGVEAAASDD